MPYLGNQAGNRFVASKAATQFSGNGSTTAFTLDHAVGSDEDILVSVDGVIQEPSVAYAVSNGTTLTFTAAPSNNSGNNIFVYYLFRTVATVDHPSTSSLQATDGTFSSTLNVTGATTLTADLTVDTDTLKVDSTNNRVGVGSASPLTALHVQGSSEADIFLRREDLTNKSWLLNVQSSTGDLNVKSRNDDGTAIATSFIAHQSGYLTKPNLPSFLTYGSPTMTDTSGNHGYFHSFGNSGQSFDNGSNYNNTTGRFTCPVAGKYMFGLSISRNQSYSGANQLIYIGKNGDVSGSAYVGSNASASQQYDQIQCHFIYNMAVNDFAVPLYYNGSGTFTTLASTPRNYFYGFLIG